MQGGKRATASEPGQPQSPRRSPRAHKDASPGAAVLVNKPRLGALPLRQTHVLTVNDVNGEPVAVIQLRTGLLKTILHEIQA